MRRFSAFAFVTLLAAAMAAVADTPAEKPQKTESDATKLPVGSVWIGTVKHLAGEKLVASTDLVIRITERKGTEFKGVWSARKGESQLAIEGKIGADGSISFEPVRRLKGDGPKIVVGNAKSTAFIKGGDEMEGKTMVPETRRHSEWTLKRRKNAGESPK